MTLGSLFAGIGGIDLACERAGLQVAWQVEIDPQATSILERHWPSVPRSRDVRGVSGGELAGTDVIAAGWPCQDLSVVGKRAGLLGGQSSLFFEVVRIVQEMRSASGGAKPIFLLLENVPGLLSSRGGRDFGAVLGALVRSGAVDIAWSILDAQWFGVP